MITGSVRELAHAGQRFPRKQHTCLLDSPDLVVVDSKPSRHSMVALLFSTHSHPVELSTQLAVVIL